MVKSIKHPRNNNFLFILFNSYYIVALWIENEIMTSSGGSLGFLSFLVEHIFTISLFPQNLHSGTQRILITNTLPIICYNLQQWITGVLEFVANAETK